MYQNYTGILVFPRWTITIYFLLIKSDCIKIFKVGLMSKGSAGGKTIALSSLSLVSSLHKTILFLL